MQSMHEVGTNWKWIAPLKGPVMERFLRSNNGTVITVKLVAQ